MDIKAVSFQSNHILIIIDGIIFGWGSNNNSQVMTTTEPILKPRKLTALPSSAKAISVTSGICHSLCLTEEGFIYVWGGNPEGQLGIKNLSVANTPTLLSDLKDIRMISAGTNHSLALSATGLVYSWGTDNSGQLGIKSGLDIYVPHQIKLLTHISAITCGAEHNLALANDGKVFAWGLNIHGQLGLGSDENSPLPQLITTLPANIISISCGQHHSAAITNDGFLYTWGRNTSLQLGYKTPSTVPKKIEKLGNVVAVSCGITFTMALVGKDKIYLWGSFLSTEKPSITPSVIDLKDNIISIAAMQNTAFAITEGGLYSWGGNKYGQLGNGSFKESPNPILVKKRKNNKPFYWISQISLLPTSEPIEESHLRKFLLNLLETGKYSNFSVIVQGKEVKLHKAIMAIHSPKLLELEEEINGLSYSEFQKILNYLYSYQITLQLSTPYEEVLRIMSFCKKYEITDLVHAGRQILFKQITKENILQIITLCQSLNLPEELPWITVFATTHNITLPFKRENPTKSQLPSIINIKSPSYILEQLFNNRTYADFTIVFKSKEYRVHKFILASRWLYFTSILRGNENISSVQHFETIPEDTFQKLVDYFYLWKISSLNIRDAGWILTYSDFYLLQDEVKLLQYCDNMINSGVNSTNWKDSLLLAIELNNPDLKKKSPLRYTLNHLSSPSGFTLHRIPRRTKKNYK